MTTDNPSVSGEPAGRRATRDAYGPGLGANYPFNHWWVVAASHEVGRERLLGRRYLGLDILLYRQQDGTVIGLEDRCVHRGLPLSMGRLEGDKIVCGYHGFCYSPQGECVRVPTQTQIPPKAAVRSFPVIEKPPFIWLWTGDAALADVDTAPYYPWLNDEAWVHALGHIHINCNYMPLKENVLDLTHFAYAHASSFEMDDDYAVPPQCSVDDGRVSFRQEFLGKALPPFYGDHCGLGQKRVDRYDEGTSFSPAEHVFTARIVNRNPAPGERNEYFVKFHHMTTPESPRSHHYWWVMARDHGLGPAAVEWMTRVITLGFDEDKVILEAIQKRIDDSPHPEALPEVSVAADLPGLHARRQLQILLDR